MADEGAPAAPREAGTGRHTVDLAVQWRMFAGFAVAVAVFAAVYWYASYDYAGTVLLALASGLSTVTAAYLWWQHRFGHVPSPDARGAGGPETPYLPHASIWPFGVGVGAFLALNGLVLGVGYAVPGIVVVGASIIGFVSQTRRRS